MATLKPKLNVPVVGVVKYADWYAAKEKDGKTVGPDVGLKGEWVGEGEATLYGPEKLFGILVDQGFVTFKGHPDAPTDVRWAYKGRVSIEKAEGEGRAHVWKVTALDAPVAAAAPATPAAAAPPANGNGNGNGKALTPEEQAEARIERCRAYWVGQRSLMQFCITLAIGEHRKVAENTADGSADGLLDAGAILTTAHSHFIQANRDGMYAPPRAPDKAEKNGGAHD